MSKRVIIYAEDNTDMRDTTRELLGLKGYEVRAHANGKLALDDVKAQVAAGVPVFLLTDNDMPVMGGVELVKSLADANIRVPTIIMSGNDAVPEMLEQQKLTDKVDLVMTKPMNTKLFDISFTTVSAKHDRLQADSPLDHAVREPALSARSA